jgi:hypothetical protein
MWSSISDNPDNQLKGFAHYISENYKLTQNDYHILMTEENWSGAAGMAYMNSHSLTAFLLPSLQNALTLLKIEG